MKPPGTDKFSKNDPTWTPREQKGATGEIGPDRFCMAGGGGLPNMTCFSHKLIS